MTKSVSFVLMTCTYRLHHVESLKSSRVAQATSKFVTKCVGPGCKIREHHSCFPSFVFCELQEGLTPTYFRGSDFDCLLELHLAVWSGVDIPCSASSHPRS
jgi:hypothetical protein